MKLGQVLRAYRTTQGLNSRQFAAELRISQATLIRLERGNTCDGRVLLLVFEWLLFDGGYV